MPITFPVDAIAIGIDIGGTKIRFGLVRSNGEVLHEFTLPTLAQEQRVMEQVFAGTDTLLSVYEDIAKDMRLDGIGIGSAGQIDFATGAVYHASDLIPGYTGTPIKQLVAECYGLPVYVDNDVNVLALAEFYIGAGRKASNLVCLAMGTGVGGAVITDGALLHGTRGGAGEIGHLSIDWRGPRCICGNNGCLELYASGTGIANRYREMRQAKEAYLIDGEANAVDVVAKWNNGDALATIVMEEAIEAMGAAITSLIHVLNPQMIIIGGGIADLGESLFAPLREYVANQAMPSMSRMTSIVPASLGGDSNMIGAALQVWVYSE